MTGKNQLKNTIILYTFKHEDDLGAASIRCNRYRSLLSVHLKVDLTIITC